jgi:membrane peptidoglycan carboxypeptidase
VSRMAVQTLRAVVQYGTGTAANLPGRQVAGKTGTTEQNTDAWFNGFTPQLATSIWMGDPKGRTPMYNVGGITVFGGTYPARIWAAYTKAALGDAPAVPFPLPDPRKIPGGKLISSPGLLKDSPFARPPATTTTTAKGAKPTTTTGPTVPGAPTTRAPPVTASPPTVKP